MENKYKSFNTDGVKRPSDEDLVKFLRSSDFLVESRPESQPMLLKVIGLISIIGFVLLAVFAPMGV